MFSRTLKLGKLKIQTAESRTLHTGIGYNTGCGYDFEAYYFVVYWNGVEKFKQILKLVYDIDIEQIKRRAK